MKTRHCDEYQTDCSALHKFHTHHTPQGNIFIPIIWNLKSMRTQFAKHFIVSFQEEMETLQLIVLQIPLLHVNDALKQYFPTREVTLLKSKMIRQL